MEDSVLKRHADHSDISKEVVLQDMEEGKTRKKKVKPYLCDQRGQACTQGGRVKEVLARDGVS